VSAREVNEEEDTVTLISDSPLRTPLALDTDGGAGAETYKATVIIRATIALRDSIEEREERKKGRGKDR
jgi:hypothetical protein